MPIHRLEEMPTRQAVVADITCDSDGKIDSFIDLRDVKHVLPLHELNHGEYYIGVFLVGAYQETLGDMHNLLGDINVLHVRVTDENKIHLDRLTPGDSVREVLSYVEYDPSEMLRRIYRTSENATKAGKINEDDRQLINDLFSAGMKGYTYFER